MSWEPITEAEFRLLLAEHVLRLDAELFARWEALGVMPERIRCERRSWDGGPPAVDPIFVVARAGGEVLVYDDVEDEFGTGTPDADGVLRRWGTWGGELSWALRRFPEGGDPADSGAGAT